MQSQFIDHVRLHLKSGKGGNGVVAWRREKFVSKGGPDGGDGGKGGSIILKGNPQLWTLLDLRYRKFISAEHGQNGMGSKKKGKNGADQILEVPLGTVIKDAETEEVLGEIIKKDQILEVLPGGHGGKGNWHFRSATNQAPEFASQGGEAREMIAILELKVLADVGLVGFPNAGKSTLLSVLSEAKPKIGAYPFTTLVPNLGIIRYRGFRSFVMADIPGIIEGAHLGKGLGIQFLRHIERNAVLLFMIPVDADDIRTEYEILVRELETYNPELAYKARIIAITKCDLIDRELEDEIREMIKDLNPIFISAIAQEGLEALKDQLWQSLENEIPEEDWET